ncbi:unnamed protein product [Rangifer tarandus platyrhynchus]|uniref:Uncharacterized protein n=1 Tax=Rangifer tarandus platyrhynchus TaxID=3082113 RepID=A0AC60A9G7_RANTA
MPELVLLRHQAGLQQALGCQCRAEWVVELWLGSQGPHSGSWVSSTISLRSVSQKKAETPSGLQATGEVQTRERLAEHSACPLHRHCRRDRSSVRREVKGKLGMGRYLGDPDSALSPPTDHAEPLRPPAVGSSKGTGTQEKEKATAPFSQL